MTGVRIVVEHTGTGFSAYSPDLPGCVSTGGTREEAEANMREAIEFHLDGLRLEGDSVPDWVGNTDPMPPGEVRGVILAGLADSEAGRTTPVEEVRRRFGLNP